MDRFGMTYGLQVMIVFIETSPILKVRSSVNKEINVINPTIRSAKLAGLVVCMVNGKRKRVW